MTNNNTAAVPAAKRTPQNCGCGCGAPTVTERALFLSGHDARLAGVVGRGLVDADPAARKAAQARLETLSPALQAKARKVVETAERKAADKAAKAKAREAAKAAAKAAYEAALRG